MRAPNRVLPVVLALGACGRVAFDPRTTDATFGTGSQCETSEGAVAHYAFTGGDMLDSGSNALHGTCDSPATCPTKAAGIVGDALQFNATAQTRMRVAGNAPPLRLDAAYTVTLFVRRANDIQSTYLAKGVAVGTKETYQLMQENGGTWAVSTYHANEHSLRSPISTAIDTWTHFALTWDAQTGTKQLFVDGAMVAQIAGLPAALFDDLDLMVGADPDAPVDSFFTGSIDEVRIYGHVLTAPDVGALAACR